MMSTQLGDQVIEACSLHRSHTPKPTYVELHHVIPQAWQRFWQPPAPYAYPGKGVGSFDLWDARTVAICRTGHGNVHFWLVRLMHGEPLPRGANRLEVVTAKLAISRFAAAGGDTGALRAAGLWGEI